MNDSQERMWSTEVADKIVFSIRNSILEQCGEEEFECLCSLYSNTIQSSRIDKFVDDRIDIQMNRVKIRAGAEVFVAKVDMHSAYTLVDSRLYEKISRDIARPDLGFIRSPDWIRLRSITDNELPIRGRNQIRFTILDETDVPVISLNVNILVVNNLGIDCLLGLYESAVRSVIRLKGDGSMILNSVDRSVEIRFCNSNESSDEVTAPVDFVIQEEGFHPYFVDERSHRLKRFRQEYQLCLEATTQLKFLDLQEQPLPPIKYDKQRIAAIQKKYAQLWVAKTGKFNIPPIRMPLQEPQRNFLVSSKEWNHPKVKYNLAGNEIQEYLKDGIIELSNSRHVNNIVIVPKKSMNPTDPEKVRVCIDARALNKHLYSPQNKAWNVEELRLLVGNAGVYTRLDLRNAFLTLPLVKEQRPLTAFRYKGRVYQFTRIPFGLVCSMAIFIKTLSEALKDVEDCVLVYIDDIVIFSKDLKQHYRDLERVLEAIARAGLTLNLGKSEFVVSQIEFVGYDINANGIRPSPKKCEAVRLMRTLQTPTDIKSFLSTANYFAKHIPAYADYMAVLTRLTRKNVEWSWGEDKTYAFNYIKE